MGRLAKRLLRMFRFRAGAGRFTVLPLSLLAGVPYLVAFGLYLANLTPEMYAPTVLWEAVFAKLFLAVAGPAALFAAWVYYKPNRKVRWAYDWIGGWMVSYAMGWLSAIGRDLLDPYRIDLAGRWIIGWSGVVWVLAGTALLVAGAVHFTQLIHTERSERQRLEALMRFTHRITSLDLQTTLDETVRELHRLLGADACVLYLWNEAEQVLIPVAGIHSSEIYADEYVRKMMAFKCPPGFGLTGAVFERGEPYICHDVTADPRSRSVPGFERAEKSSILAPLILEGRKLGVVRLTRQGIHEFTQDDLDLALSFTGQATLLIEHGRVLQELSELSITDSLTGLYNARQFHRVLDREVQMALRHDTSLSLLMIDSDSLKLVNDRLGHQMGDHYLREIARVVKAETRKTDFAFRYAGDEFLIILPMTDVQWALEVAERIRTAVAEIDLGQEVPCTISLGVANFPVNALDGEGLLGAADEAMYLSKRSGKNRTSLSHRSPIKASG
ncbi:MAG: sensor domain-containing diguanylate cyclase [Bacillota bacterium]